MIKKLLCAALVMVACVVSFAAGKKGSGKEPIRIILDTDIGNDVDDALAFLRNARQHLVSGGLLGIEVSAFSPEELVDPPGGTSQRHDFTRELANGRLDRYSVSHYDAATQLMQMRLFYERYGASGALESRRAHDLTIRVVGRSELELMLQLTGFEVEAVYGGFEGEPFTSMSDHLIVLARK